MYTRTLKSAMLSFDPITSVMRNFGIPPKLCQFFVMLLRYMGMEKWCFDEGSSFPHKPASRVGIAPSVNTAEVRKIHARASSPHYSQIVRPCTPHISPEENFYTF